MWCHFVDATDLSRRKAHWKLCPRMAGAEVLRGAGVPSWPGCPSSVISAVKTRWWWEVWQPWRLYLQTQHRTGVLPIGFPWLKSFFFCKFSSSEEIAGKCTQTTSHLSSMVFPAPQGIPQFLFWQKNATYHLPSPIASVRKGGLENSSSWKSLICLCTAALPFGLILKLCPQALKCWC